MNIIVKIRTAGSGSFVDRSTLIQWPTFDEEQVLTNQTDTLTFSIGLSTLSGYVPDVGDEVQVYDGASLIFSGFVTYVNNTSDVPGSYIFQVTCNDYTYVLDGVLIAAEYLNQSVGSIIADIITKVNAITTPFGVTFTGNNVDCPLLIDKIQFNYIQASKCLKKLADTYLYYWYVDYAKDIHFFSDFVETAPFNLNDDPTSKNDFGNYIYNSLQVSRDISQMRNWAIAAGGTAPASASRHEDYYADGIQTSFPLTYDYNTPPTVSVAGVAQTVGLDGTDSFASYQCLWNQSTRSIRFNSAVAANAHVIITGLPNFPILAQAQNTKSMALYSVQQYKVSDTTIKTFLASLAAANAQVSMYGAPIVQGQFKTYRSGLRTGQLLTIKVAGRNFNITAVINQCVLNMFSQSDGIWTVNFMASFSEAG